MTNEELAWLAGWLEGEGSFCYGAYRNLNERSRTHKAYTLAINSFCVDRDIVARAAKIAGAAMYEIQPRCETTWNRQVGWRFAMTSEPAADLMRMLLPYMGERRSEQIKKALDGWDNRPTKPVEKVCACGCGRTFIGPPRRLYFGTNRQGFGCGQRAYRQRMANR